MFEKLIKPLCNKEKRSVEKTVENVKNPVAARGSGGCRSGYFLCKPATYFCLLQLFVNPGRSAAEGHLPDGIRGGAVAIAVAFQWISNFIVSSSFVPMFNMHLTEGDDFGHWFTYGLYGIICVVAALFVWKLVPETKGKTLEDMTKLWKNNK